MLITLRIGFSFVCFKDEHNAEVAIEGLNNKKYGENILRVIWAKGSVSGLNRRPTKTLLVSSLNSRRIGKYDIERHFEKYGEVDNVRMNRKSALVRFKTQGNATKALKSAHMSTIHRRVIFVEYALRDDDDTGGRYDRPRGDYGRRNGASCRSPSTEHRRRRLSPDRWRARSPDYDSRTYPRERSPDRVRHRSRSPERRYHGTVSPDRGRDRSPDHNRPSNERVRSPDRLRDGSRSPVRRHQGPSYPRGRSRLSPDRRRDRSPHHKRRSNERARSPDRSRDRRRSPVRRRSRRD